MHLVQLAHGGATVALGRLCWTIVFPLIIPLQLPGIQSSFVALCKDALPCENSENLNWQQRADSKLLMAARG